jgi:signal transduction histidine kinase/DNA-binding response OmpR family regulator
MSKTIRVLIVEDSENDALLLVRELRRGGFEPAFERVDTADAMAAALAKQTWDLVLADYNMPHFSGIAALELLKHIGLDIPFIVVSGSIGEDVAVAAMKAGAHDYMMKGNLQRLIPSIERELRDAEVRREHRQAEMKIKRDSERLQALHEINLAITSTLDLRAALEILLEKIDLVLPYSATTVNLFDQETGELEPVACHNINEKEWKAIKRKGVHGLAKMVLENKTPLTVSDVQTDSRSAISGFARKEGLVSYLGIPLIAKGESLGLIAFYTKEEHAFSDDEIEFLTTLASQAAIALYNSRLFEQIKLSGEKLESTNQRLQKSLKELSGLHAALAPLSPGESVTDMLDGIVERLIEITRADAALIRLHDREKGIFYWATQRGFPDYYLKAAATPPPGSALEWLFRTGEPILAPDIAADPRLKGKIQLQAGFRSCAMLPLKVQNEVRGVIHLASRELGYFDESRKDNLLAISRLMSIALENKGLFEELRISRDALEKSNKVKDEFLSVISHELRTPLNVIKGYTEILREGVLGEINAAQENALATTMKNAMELLRVINSVLQVTLIQSEAVSVLTHEFNLGDFIKSLRSDYDGTVADSLTLDWKYSSDLPFLKTDDEKLKVILQNLIDNAIKFTEKGIVSISVAVDRDASKIVFAISDTGMGISKERLPFIFDMFKQADSSDTRRYGGVGLGLYISKKLTELLGGTIEVESESGKGSVFTVAVQAVLESKLAGAHDYYRSAIFRPTEL